MRLKKARLKSNKAVPLGSENFVAGTRNGTGRKAVTPSHLPEHSPRGPQSLSPAFHFAIVWRDTPTSATNCSWVFLAAWRACSSPACSLMVVLLLYCYHSYWEVIACLQSN